MEIQWQKLHNKKKTLNVIYFLEDCYQSKKFHPIKYKATIKFICLLPPRVNESV